jgi:transcriptional regulator with XRE-family HTH domain
MARPESRTAKKRAPRARKKRVPVVKQPVIAAHLTILRGSRSIRQFATDCGVNHRRLGLWLRGENAPDADNLRRIAVAEGVSLDWLLGIPNVAMLRGQSRDPASLEQDVAAFVTRQLEQRYRDPDGLPEPYLWLAQGEKILEGLIDDMSRAAEETIRAAQQQAVAARAIPVLEQSFRTFIVKRADGSWRNSMP